MEKNELNFFKDDAKVIVDTMFNTDYFDDSVTRDNMVSLEELIAYMLQSRFDSRWRAQQLSEKFKTQNASPK